jgi:hypothetical protein
MKQYNEETAFKLGQKFARIVKNAIQPDIIFPNLSPYVGVNIGLILPSPNAFKNPILEKSLQSEFEGFLEQFDDIFWERDKYHLYEQALEFSKNPRLRNAFLRGFYSIATEKI